MRQRSCGPPSRPVIQRPSGVVQAVVRPIASIPRAAVALMLATANPAWAQAPPDTWLFSARLDDRPIGTHRFTLSSDANGIARLESEAAFDVTLLGIPVYRYRHRASERWRGDCLESIDATTDDNGRSTAVRGRRGSPGEFDLEPRDGRPRQKLAVDCLMSFAYWQPALANQRTLLDPGTGRPEPVVIEPLPPTSIEVEGTPRPVRGLRISGLPRPIDVWYEGTRWVGLDTVVSGGRRLSYSLR